VKLVILPGGLRCRGGHGQGRPGGPGGLVPAPRGRYPAEPVL